MYNRKKGDIVVAINHEQGETKLFADLKTACTELGVSYRKMEGGENGREFPFREGEWFFDSISVITSKEVKYRNAVMDIISDSGINRETVVRFFQEQAPLYTPYDDYSSSEWAEIILQFA